MSRSRPRYILDTSALIAAWDERYPIDIFPSLWSHFADAADLQFLASPDEVHAELSKRSKDLQAWLDKIGDYFIETDSEVLREVSRILSKHEKLVAEKKRASAADPFVVALAKIHRAVVVTEEGRGSLAKPKISDVCEYYDVECINFLEFMKRNRWKIG